MKGWVYVISNKAMPGLVKVGYSAKDPKQRAKELGMGNAGSPHPYVVEYDALVEDPENIEKKTHKQLSAKHEAKEWFRCSTEEAVTAIKQVVGENIFHETYAKIERNKIEALLRVQQMQAELAKAQENKENLIRERFQKEEDAIRQKYAKIFAQTCPPVSTKLCWFLGCVICWLIVYGLLNVNSDKNPGLWAILILPGYFIGLYVQDFFDNIQKKSTKYTSLVKQRESELASIRKSTTPSPKECTQEAVTSQPAQKICDHQGRQVGRNDPCPCGSGIKYKQCHGFLLRSSN